MAEPIATQSPTNTETSAKLENTSTKTTVKAEENELDPKSTKKNAAKPVKPTFSDFLSLHKSYILGVVVGISLLILNTYVGLYITRLLLDDENLPVTPGVSLPAINLDDYEAVKTDRQNREVKELRVPSGIDPFGTN